VASQARKLPNTTPICAFTPTNVKSRSTLNVLVGNRIVVAISGIIRQKFLIE